MGNDNIKINGAIGCGVAVLAVFALLASPIYNVWRAGQSGLAELRKAEQNRQIAIEEAKAKMESAKMLSEAEIVRARGVAEANVIKLCGAAYRMCRPDFPETLTSYSSISAAKLGAERLAKQMRESFAEDGK